MDVSRVFQRSFKKTFKVFQKKFHVAWHSSQLPEQKEGFFTLKIVAPAHDCLCMNRTILLKILENDPFFG